MKKFIFIAAFSFVAASCLAQFESNTNVYSKYILRSTVGINGLSKTVKLNSKTFYIQQSIGQASVIGTYSNNNGTIRQGFIQPLSTVKARLTNIIESNLQAEIFPNPFYQSINISFNDVIKNDFLVEIYNLSGSIMFMKNYSATQQIDIPLNDLPKEVYMLKITTENKQLIKKLIKR